MKLAYPDSPRLEQVDRIHGVRVPDPYRWLEDIDSEQTKQWIAAQNRLTSDYLNEIPARGGIRQRLAKLWNYERRGVPFKRGDRYFFTRNDGLQNQDSLYWTESLESDPQLLLDPNRLSAEGTIALSGYSVSEDGQLLAYGLSASGLDWQEWRIRDVATGQDLSDHLKGIKLTRAGTISWTHDRRGFFYSRTAALRPGGPEAGGNFFREIWYHRLGTPQSEDRRIYERPDRTAWQLAPYVTRDGRYLIVKVSRGADHENGVFYQDLSIGDGAIVELLDEFDASYAFAGNDGPLFYFVTDLDAPRSRVIAIDVTRPERSNWQEIVAESTDILQSACLAGGLLAAIYLHDAYAALRILDKAGRLVHEIELPGMGTVEEFVGQPGEGEAFYSFTGFTTPHTVWRCDLETGRSTVLWQPDLPFDPQAYETRQVFYPSRDGTRVPMFVSHKKGLTPDADTPAYLYGYGGWNLSQPPLFSVEHLVWMEMGGIFALANLRGGGEYGRAWHLAGHKLQRQNVYDDFIAAAEWLIENEYTSTPKLAIGGRSNGGLLVGACETQRPDLFAACLPVVGVLDMLRFHRFTVGWGWTSEYGSPEDPDEFEVLLSYSPYHRVEAGTAYPATLVVTGDHDDHVLPAHSYKFAAALQAAQAGPDPVLIRIVTHTGHKWGKPVSKLIAEMGDRLAFLHYTLRMGNG